MNNSVMIRLYAAARAAAGMSEISVAPGRLDLMLEVVAQGNPELTRVFSQCSFLVDGIAVHDKGAEIRANSTVDALPPFAGG